jgi:hypothetical protein
MWRFFPVIAILSALVLSACGGYEYNHGAYRTNHNQMVIPPVPAPKEVVMIPRGYVNCSVIPAGYDNNGYWVPKHRVCTYANQPGRAAWIEGYWSCPSYQNNGICRQWIWNSGRWVSTYRAY